MRRTSNFFYKREQLTKTLLILFVFVLFFITLQLNKKEVIFSYEDKEDKMGSVDVGQIWRVSYYKDNPYREEENYYNEIIDMSGDYVLYIQDGKDTLSQTLYWFVVNSECIENCDADGDLPVDNESED